MFGSLEALSSSHEKGRQNSIQQQLSPSMSRCGGFAHFPGDSLSKENHDGAVERAKPKERAGKKGDGFFALGWIGEPGMTERARLPVTWCHNSRHSMLPQICSTVKRKNPIFLFSRRAHDGKRSLHHSNQRENRCRSVVERTSCWLWLPACNRSVYR